MPEEHFQLLLVDDDEDDALFIRRMIDASELDCKMKWVDTYAAALATLAEHHYDVCLLDYNLSGHKGIELLREDWIGSLETSFIMLTGQDDGALGVAAMKAGADDYLIKSVVDKDSLERTIRYAVERRLAKQLMFRMGRIMDASANEIYLFDAGTLTIVQSNAKVRANLGYSERDLNTLRAPDLVWGITHEAFEGWIALLRGGERQHVLFEAEHRRKDGSHYPVEIHLQLFAAERPPLFVATVLDVSDRREHENQMQRAQKMEAVGQLASGLAHDFNNLLTVVCGNLEMLRLSEADATAWSSEELIEEAYGAAQRGVDLTQRLLTFSRAQPLEPSATDLGATLTSMKELLQRTLGPAATLELEIDAQVPAVLIDPGQFENSLLNLALNAGDAMPGGGTLRVTLDSCDSRSALRWNGQPFDTANCVRVRVTDNGTGIAADALTRVCEPFFTTKDPGRGTGLGLSMVYGFTRQSGGHLGIESSSGVGTEITLLLPPAPPGMRVEEDTASTRVTHGDPGAETVFVVEDDVAVRRMATRALTQLGYTVIEAASGDEAMALLEQGIEFDLMFTDVFMPGALSGTMLARHVLERMPQRPVIMTSGFREQSENVRLPGFEFLPKPYSTIELSRLVRRSLDRTRI